MKEQNMNIIICYKDYQIGKLSYDGKCYIYDSLPGKKEFIKNYGFIDFSLANVDHQTFKKLPFFFSQFVDKLIHNVEMSTILNINLNKDNYFSILFRYAKLPQQKNTFYFIAN